MAPLLQELLGPCFWKRVREREREREKVMVSNNIKSPLDNRNTLTASTYSSAEKKKRRDCPLRSGRVRCESILELVFNSSLSFSQPFRRSTGSGSINGRLVCCHTLLYCHVNFCYHLPKVAPITRPTRKSPYSQKENMLTDMSMIFRRRNLDPWPSLEKAFKRVMTREFQLEEVDRHCRACRERA